MYLTHDVVDKYQITSDEQREKLCEILRNEHTSAVKEVSPTQINEPIVTKESENVITIDQNTEKSDTVSVKTDNIPHLVSSIINSSKRSGKRTIKISIEIVDE